MLNRSELSIHDFKDLYRKYGHEEYLTGLCNLWHYTSADGLMGIIKDEPSKHKKMRFWFTRSDCLNDPSEGMHILSLYRQMCDEMLEQNAISEQFYEAVKDAEIPNSQFFNFPIPARGGYAHESVLALLECHAYICSFSLKEDSLDMWRYYSKGNEGYGLKCFPSLFDNYKSYEHSVYDENAVYCVIRSYKVIYSDEIKKQILKNIITDTFSAYSNSEESENEKRQSAKGFIQYALKFFQFRFKHECYESEQEYRFVVYVPCSKPIDLKNDMPTIKYRKQNGMPIPYIELEVENGSLLEEVLISPFIKSDNASNATKDYLSQCGFDCEVRLSQLPVRQ